MPVHLLLEKNKKTELTITTFRVNLATAHSESAHCETFDSWGSVGLRCLSLQWFVGENSHIDPGLWLRRLHQRLFYASIVDENGQFYLIIEWEVVHKHYGQESKPCTHNEKAQSSRRSPRNIVCHFASDIRLEDSCKIKSSVHQCQTSQHNSKSEIEYFASGNSWSKVIKD